MITLIKTDSYVLLEEYLASKIKKDCKKITYVYDKNMADILEEASYGSLFAEEKVVLVKNADFFGKEKLSEKEEKMLLKYLEQPFITTELIFITYGDIDKRKSITKKIIEKYTWQELMAPKGYELTNEIKKRLQKYKIGDKEIKYLQDATINQFDLICNEITKFSLYFNEGDAITLKDLKEIVPSSLHDNLFNFTDAVIKKDNKTTFKLLAEFKEMKIDALQIILLLVREFRLLLYYKIYEEQKYNLKDIGRLLKLQDWQVTKIMKNASFFHQDDLKKYLLQLANLDAQIKSGQEDKNDSLITFLVTYFS